MSDKPTFARMRDQVEERLDDIEERMAEGMAPRTAERYARERYGLSKRQATRYIAAIKHRWAEESRHESETVLERRGRLRATLWMAFNAAYKSRKVPGNMSAASKLLDSLIAFEGLAEPTKLELNVSFEDRVRALQEFVGAAGMRNRALEQLESGDKGDVIDAECEEVDDGDKAEAEPRSRSRVRGW